MPDPNQKINNQNGANFLVAINNLGQITRLYEDNNKLVTENIDKFITLIKQAGDGEEDIDIRLSEGRFYYQGRKLLLRRSNAKLFNRMVPFFEDRGISGLNFHIAPEYLTPEKIICFFRLANQSTGHSAPFNWLTDKLIENEIRWVTVSKEHYPPQNRWDAPQDESGRKKTLVRKSYAGALKSTREIAQKLSSNKPVGIRNAVRFVQNMTDIIMEDETLFMCISTVRVYDDYTYTHSLNVSILAMCLGKRIGLGKESLERLGLCGLFHDLGKVEIPVKVLNKKGALSKEEFALLQTHTMHSARLILRLKAKNERKRKLLVPPFEHHMGYDHSGYPKTPTGPRISLFGRILTIVDVYDAITSPRVYRKKTYSPDEALKKIMAEAGTHFDPILVKVFVNMLGKYPVGTLVELDNGEIGLVQKPSEDLLTRPVVQLLIPEEKTGYRKGAVIDLSDRDEETGHYLHNITKSLHPSKLGIQPAEFFLS
jgi:HD-GYP domain-containing protein (c-di-GMP phosphodiesterase class II)